jgi:TetR/AcrR family transcriptional regulator
LIRRILQRGMDRGEFRKIDLDYAVYSVVAPMIFLILAKHSLCVCVPDNIGIDPKKYIAAQLSTILYGLSTSPDDAAQSPEKAKA